MFSKVLLLVFGLCLTFTQGFEDKTIAQWLTDNGYSSLVSFLKTGGLYSTLDSPGAHTMFAPTEAAFSKLDPATITRLTSDSAFLRSVLMYHVTDGFAMAPTLQDGATKQTLNGQSLTFHKLANGTLYVDNAMVSPTANDIILNNGVVHVIDKVLLPITDKIGEILLRRNDEFSTLNMLLTITDLEPALLTGKLTLFAPTNAAFSAITQQLPTFNSPNAINTYKQILLNHVVNSTVLSSALQNGQSVTALSGKQLNIQVGSTGVAVLAAGGSQAPAKVTEADVKASNGVIHVIDHVLIPSGLRRRGAISRIR